MNQLKTKIDEVKEKLGLTQMQLSERIGKNPYYLDTVKHRVVTTERQNELMLELDLVANGGEVITERSIVAVLTEKAESLQEKLNKAQAANNKLSHKLNIAEHEYKDLDEAYGRACEKLAEVNKENNLIMAVNGVLTKEQSNLNKEVASLQEYKHHDRRLVAIVIAIGVIVIWGLIIWSVV